MDSKAFYFQQLPAMQEHFCRSSSQRKSSVREAARHMAADIPPSRAPLDPGRNAASREAAEQLLRNVSTQRRSCSKPEGAAELRSCSKQEGAEAEAAALRLNGLSTIHRSRATSAR